MNCYVCLLETGCESRPALAICQICGAGICHVHLVERTVPPVTGMAGSPRFSLMCSRCIASPRKRITTRKPPNKQNKRKRLSLQYWWRWLQHEQQVALPTPEEAVEAAESFLKRGSKP
jgi:hypothetical protein